MCCPSPPRPLSGGPWEWETPHAHPGHCRMPPSWVHVRGLRELRSPCLWGPPGRRMGWPPFPAGPMWGWERWAVASLLALAALQATGGPTVSEPSPSLRLSRPGPAGHVGEGLLCLTPREPGPGGQGASRGVPGQECSGGRRASEAGHTVGRSGGLGGRDRGLQEGGRQLDANRSWPEPVRLCPQAQGPLLVHPEGGGDPETFQLPWSKQCSGG